MFPPGARLGVAISGGADSVFLLHALLELAPRWNLQLSTVHVDHGIRGAQSHADAAFVADLAARHSLPFHLRQADVPAIDDNMEQAARRVRQAFFADLLSTGAVDRIATGHTRSDQAETVLYRILRGSGLPGLAGILPVTKEQIVRPSWNSTAPTSSAGSASATSPGEKTKQTKIAPTPVIACVTKFCLSCATTSTPAWTKPWPPWQPWPKMKKATGRPNWIHCRYPAPQILSTSELTALPTAVAPPPDPPGHRMRQRRPPPDRLRPYRAHPQNGSLPSRSRPGPNPRPGRPPVL